MNLKNRIALITGAGSGIGRAMAQALATEGVDLWLVGRRSEALEKTASLLTAPAHLHPADISVASDVEELVETILRESGQLDFLINNAGIFPAKKPVHETTIRDWDQTMATNVRGPFLLTRAVLPGMLTRDFGRIVNVSAPIKHLPQAAAYCASKMALDSLTKTTAFELRGKNILVNAIEPPFCDTEMHVGGKEPSVVVPTLLELLQAGPDGASGRLIKIEQNQAS